MDKVKSFAASIAETFQASMGIHSPSTLFASYGGYLTDGLAIGIDRGQMGPIRKVKSLTAQLGNIAGDIRIDRSTAGAVQLDRRPPLSVGRAPGVAAAGQTNIEIHIHAAPGMDPNAIAQAVSRELDQRERARSARMRSSYIDI